MKGILERDTFCPSFCLNQLLLQELGRGLNQIQTENSLSHYKPHGHISQALKKQLTQWCNYLIRGGHNGSLAKLTITAQFTCSQMTSIFRRLPDHSVRSLSASSMH